MPTELFSLFELKGQALKDYVTLRRESPDADRKKYGRGYIIAFSFTRGAYEEVVRLKKKGELEIKLVKVKDLLYKRKPVL